MAEPPLIKHFGSRLNLHTLQIFLTVVETGSLSEAAAHEHLVVSAISRRIAELERVVGVALLERRQSGIVPTHAGLELVEHAQELKRMLERMEEHLDKHHNGLRGEVRLHASPGALLDLLPKRLTAFMSMYPEVEVSLKEWDSTQIIRSLRKGSAHIGIISSYVPAPELRRLPYMKNPLLLAVPAGHPLLERQQSGGGVRFEDTLQYDHVVVQDGSGSFSALLLHMQDIASRHDASFRIRMRVASVGSACRFVEAGIGISILPGNTVQLFEKALDIVAIALLDEWAATEHQLCMRDDIPLPRAAQKLVEHLSAPA